MSVQMSPIEARERWFAELRWKFACEHIEPHIAEASNDPSAQFFLPNHEALIRSYHAAVCIVKCRKAAHSWGISLKNLCRAITEPRSTGIIGSYDEEEAKEKLNFLDWQYSVLPKGMRAELGMTDGMEVRRFNNGSRIRFISRKAPTGAGASIDWDEFSVEKPGRVTANEILAAALACTTHTGQVSIGGTQRGPDTVFNQIVTGQGEKVFEGNPLFDALPKVAWKIYYFPWWKIPALCNDVIKAVRMAPGMATEDRVMEFGNEKLLRQFALYCKTQGQGLDMFQREFEMMVLDDRESYFDLPLINSCRPSDFEHYYFDFTNIDGANYRGPNSPCLDAAKKLIDKLAEAIRHRRLPPGEWGWAMDVGRDHDVDEIFVGQNLLSNRELLLPRLNIGASLLPFAGKEEIVHYLLRAIPQITRGQIDATKGGYGRALQDKMFPKYGYRAAMFEFSNASKQIIVSGLKARMESNRLILPKRTTSGMSYDKVDKQLLQFKKYISEAGNVMFDVERNKGHHGDAALSLCMLSELFSSPKSVRPRRGATAMRPGPNTPMLPTPTQYGLALRPRR